MVSLIHRNNFTSVLNMDDDQRQQPRVQEVKFFANSNLANEAFQGKSVKWEVQSKLCHHIWVRQFEIL